MTMMMMMMLVTVPALLISSSMMIAVGVVFFAYTVRVVACAASRAVTCVVSRVVAVARVVVNSLTTTINQKILKIKKEPKPTKSVRFGNVHVRNYEVVLGKMPFSADGERQWCEGGAPLSLGWKYDDDENANNNDGVTVDAYEEMRSPVRRSTYIRKGKGGYMDIAALSLEHRIEVLMAHGYEFLPVPTKPTNVLSLISMDDYDERWTTHEEEQRLSNGKKVRFGDVHVRSYNVIPGDHPKSKYCPVSLGWEYSPQKQMSVHDYEALRAPVRCGRRSEMRYTEEEREAIWKDSGCHWSPEPQSVAEKTTQPLRRSARLQAQLCTAAPLRRSARLQARL